jgi:hypothetical protein
MANTLELRSRVLPGGRIEIFAPELPVGQEVSVSVQVCTQDQESGGHSALDVIEEGPGGLMFRTPEEVDAYIREERAAWGD